MYKMVQLTKMQMRPKQHRDLAVQFLSEASAWNEESGEMGPAIFFDKIG